MLAKVTKVQGLRAMAQVRAFSQGMAAANYDYQRVFGHQGIRNIDFKEFPEMDGSFMKVVGEDVDTHSADY